MADSMGARKGEEMKYKKTIRIGDSVSIIEFESEKMSEIIQFAKAEENGYGNCLDRDEEPQKQWKQYEFGVDHSKEQTENNRGVCSKCGRVHDYIVHGMSHGECQEQRKPNVPKPESPASRILREDGREVK